MNQRGRYRDHDQNLHAINHVAPHFTEMQPAPGRRLLQPSWLLFGRPRMPNHVFNSVGSACYLWAVPKPVHAEDFVILSAAKNLAQLHHRSFAALRMTDCHGFETAS